MYSKNETASWSTQYLLSLQSLHGPASCDVTDCWYDADTEARFRVTATEAADANGARYRFAGWTGNFTGAAADGSLLMDGPKTVIAHWEELPPDFNIFSVPWQERKNYRYEGPEIIYTFWAKHGPCQREGCGHRTPIMSTPVVAIKTPTVDAWQDWECRGCGKKFDVERHAARMAPDVPLFVAPDEKPFAVMDNEGRFTCPHCGKARQDAKAFTEKKSPELGKAKNKKVELTLLIHPQWLEGCPK